MDKGKRPVRPSALRAQQTVFQLNANGNQNSSDEEEVCFWLFVQNFAILAKFDFWCLHSRPPRCASLLALQLDDSPRSTSANWM